MLCSILFDVSMLFDVFFLIVNERQSEVGRVFLVHLFSRKTMFFGGQFCPLIIVEVDYFFRPCPFFAGLLHLFFFYFLFAVDGVGLEAIFLVRLECCDGWMYIYFLGAGEGVEAAAFFEGDGVEGADSLLEALEHLI